jgi:hypothetical protein
MSSSPWAPSSAKDQFILRLPAGMRDHLKSLAATNRRSMNAELLLLIEKGLGLSGAVAPTGVGEKMLNSGRRNMA